jgi:hypothetical protein
MRPFLKIIGGLAIVLISFWGTLFLIGTPEYENNQLRAKHARLLADALEKYRQARGMYPVLPENPVDDLKRELVEGKFLDAIPNDPARAATGRQYRYAGGGRAYGLLITLEPEPALAGVSKAKPAMTCAAGVNIKGSGAWGDPPACPF